MDKFWKLLNAPIVILIVGSIIVGRGIIIPVLGTQPSIPITLVVILIVFLVMTASFYLGGFYLAGGLVEGLMKWRRMDQRLPLRYRLLFKAASLMASVNPILWFQGRMYRSKRQQQRRSEAVLQVLARMQAESKGQQREPPADTSQ